MSPFLRKHYSRFNRLSRNTLLYCITKTYFSPTVTQSCDPELYIPELFVPKTGKKESDATFTMSYKTTFRHWRPIYVMPRDVMLRDVMSRHLFVNLCRPLVHDDHSLQPTSLPLPGWPHPSGYSGQCASGQLFIWIKISQSYRPFFYTELQNKLETKSSVQ
jgi:hypothetical protein